MNSLKKQTIKSIKWTTFQTIIAGIIGPVTLIFKSRFLSPEKFGYLSIILIVIGLFHLLENFGFSQAVIQRDKITKQESSTIFFFNIFFTTLLAIIVFFIADWIAIMYSIPELEHYLQLVSLIVFINGPSHLFRAFLEKEIFFKHLSIISIVRNIINLVSIIVLLYLDFGVLGVVYAHILSTLFATGAIIVFSVKLTSVKLSVFFKVAQLYPFLRFGFFVSGKQLLTFGSQRLDELLIGYFLSPEILGVYHFGKQMLEKLRVLITSSFSKVLFPVFSNLKMDKNRLSIAYQQVSRIVAFGAFPIFTGIAATAHLLVPVIFGEQWEDSIIVFQVFSVAMIFLLLTANISTALLYSVNKPDLVFYIDLITINIYFVSLFVFASKGIIPILVVYSLYIIYKTIILQYYTNKQLVQNFRSYFKDLAQPAIFSLIMVFSILIVQHYASNYTSNTILLISATAIGILVYILLSFTFAKHTINELIALVKNKPIIEK
ncbi:MAG: oligosaccharide flippase family protein [Thermotogota bacterium]